MKIVSVALLLACVFNAACGGSTPPPEDAADKEFSPPEPVPPTLEEPPTEPPEPAEPEPTAAERSP